jgi:hypothetical protein
MKKFMLVLLIVLMAIGILAACAPIQEGVEYAKALPGWAIVIGAIVVFCIGFGIIWKLIPGFIKVIALIALVVIVAGTAYGLWQIPLVDDAIDEAENLKNEYLIDDEVSDEPAETAAVTE